MHDPNRATAWTRSVPELDKAALYRDLGRELDALLSGEPDATANAANAAAAIITRSPI